MEDFPRLLGAAASLEGRAAALPHLGCDTLSREPLEDDFSGHQKSYCLLVCSLQPWQKLHSGGAAGLFICKRDALRPPGAPRFLEFRSQPEAMASPLEVSAYRIAWEVCFHTGLGPPPRQ